MSIFNTTSTLLSRVFSAIAHHSRGVAPDDSLPSLTSHLISAREDSEAPLYEDVLTRANWTKFLNNCEDGSGEEVGNSQVLSSEEKQR